MSLTVSLMVNSSPVEKIGKTLSEGLNFTASLKDDTSILNPVLILSSTAQAPLTGYNYMYIQEFNRYYFIDDVKSVRNNVWEVSGHVDVLETYKNAILANDAVLSRQQNMYNTYLNDPEWRVYANENVVAYKFPTAALNKTLRFVLAVAGS